MCQILRVRRVVGARRGAAAYALEAEENGSGAM